MTTKEEEPQTPETPKREMQVLSESAITRGVYSNVAIIRHTPEEFILDFLLQPGVGAETPQLVSRVILSPGHAERLVKVLKDNIEKRRNTLQKLKKKKETTKQ